MTNEPEEIKEPDEDFIEAVQTLSNQLIQFGLSKMAQDTDGSISLNDVALLATAMDTSADFLMKKAKESLEDVG